MATDTEKIWKAVTSLDRADIHTTALCHTIINLMIDNEIVSRKEATRQIEKSIVKVVTAYRQIAHAMQDQDSDLGVGQGLKKMQ
jgi:hypothetical protein